MGSGIEIDEILLYDGECKFCNGTVNFILRNEKRPNLKFSPLQSQLSFDLAEFYGFDNSKLNTIVFIKSAQVYIKSEAVFKIASYLKFPWILLTIFKVLPSFLTDYFYDFIANNRYRFFGKSKNCILPNISIKSRFLDST